MEKHERIALTGQAHWSARGELGSDKWYWWVEIEGVNISDDEMLTHALTGEKGIGFIEELRPLLPEAYRAETLMETRSQNGYIRMPDGIPGGTWDFKLPLSDCSEPKKAAAVVQKYFPKLFALA